MTRCQETWIPACAGMTVWRDGLGPHDNTIWPFGRSSKPRLCEETWIPACAGMTILRMGLIRATPTFARLSKPRLYEQTWIPASAGMTVLRVGLIRATLTFARLSKPRLCETTWIRAVAGMTDLGNWPHSGIDGSHEAARQNTTYRCDVPNTKNKNTTNKIPITKKKIFQPDFGDSPSTSPVCPFTTKR